MTLHKAVESIAPDGDGTLRVTTRDCTMCGKPGQLDGVPADAVAAWMRGLAAQDAFPGLPAPDRELLLSGIHPSCYSLFAPEPEPGALWRMTAAGILGGGAGP